VKKTPAVATPVTEKALPAGLRRYLYATAALTGAAVMIIEILGAKMLAPYVGNSHFVWTAQIAVTLVALSTGYYAGGKLVDRSPRPGRLYWCIMWAALFMALSTALCGPVAFWCLSFPLAVGSLLASALLFFVPLALLAMVGPFVVRVLTQAVANVGETMGRLTAISTLGSVAGTVLIGYVVVPFVPNSVTMWLTSLALMAGCAGYFFGWGRRQSSVPALIVVALLAAGLGWQGARYQPVHRGDVKELFRGNSNFGLLQVMDMSESEGGGRFYLNDFLVQDMYDPGPDQKKSTGMFTYMLHGLARVYATNLEDVLCIGLGVGIVPMEFARDGARVDVVEINPAVVPLGQKYFDLQPEKLHLIIGDGRYYLNECRKKYDAVILDAFLGDASPTHLMSREAFAAMRRVLKPGGVLVINSFGNFDRGRDFFTASLNKTLKAVFASVKIHEGGNVLFAASDRTPLDFLRSPDLSQVHPAARWRVERAYPNVMDTDPDHGRVLTDDFNPAEYYDAVNREETRRRLVSHFMPSREQ
jgi:SAM-dependent methyltransferase